MQINQYKYTITPLDPQQQKQLQKWIYDKQFPSKLSLCRFYLRGICIMKKQFCRFAHGIDDLNLQSFQQLEDNTMSDRQKRKVQNNYKVFFNQKPLFYVIPINYQNLYQYQSEVLVKNDQTWKFISIADINSSFNQRNKIRSYFHQWIWTNFIELLSKKYPNMIFTNQWMQKQYIKYGFTKPHTHCKYHSFLTFISKSNRFARHDLIIPPYLQTKTSVIFDMNSQQEIWKIATLQYMKFKNEQLQIIKIQNVGKQNRKEIINKYLGSKLIGEKQTICKYYMKGVCIFNEQQCKYLHSINRQIYEKREYTITDQKWFYQPPLYFQKNRNYVALWKYQHKIKQKINKDYQIHTLQQINIQCNLRQQIRKIMHLQLYQDFMKLLQEQYQGANFTLAFLQRQYTNYGFNKTTFNKFPHFIEQLKQIFYYQDSFLMPPYLQKKTKFVFKIPQLEILDKYFQNKFIKNIQLIIKSRNSEQIIVLNESDLRKKFYEQQDVFYIPLHEYLKLKKLSFKQYMISNVYKNKQLAKFQQNVKFDLTNNTQKIKQKIKQYLQYQKKYIHSLTDVQNKIKTACQTNITNYFTNSNFKVFLVQYIIQLGKKVYMWNIVNQAIILDKKYKNKSNTLKYCICKSQPLPQLLQIHDKLLIEKYSKQRIVVINSIQTINYAISVLKHIKEVGVDLQGKLSKNGYIYLIQLGIKNHFNNNQNQIVIFDIFQIQKNQNPKLLIQTRNVLRFVLQNKDIVKIMHDCRQDSTALHFLLKICLQNVFDMCGMHIFYQQKKMYEHLKQRSQTYRKLYQISNKVPGLNFILEYYKSPNGINALKQKMKTNFQLGVEEKTRYFQTRPINNEFLQYAARDVEDLIDIYRKMKVIDDDNLGGYIGIRYSTYGLNQLNK